MNLVERGHQRAADRRRYPRAPVVQPARLRIGEHPEIRCEIRDYHPAGLFIRLSAGIDRAKAWKDLVGASAQVRFTRVGSPDGPWFRLAGRVARIAEAGIGIALVEPAPADAWAALDELDQRARAGTRSDAPPAEPHARVERACREALAECLEQSLGAFASGVDGAILDAAALARSGGERTGLLDARTRLRNPEPLGRTLRRLALAQAERYALLADGGRTQSFTPRQLALVDQQAFEDWLNLLSEATRLESVHQRVLHRLQQRLTRVAGTPVHEKNNPYAPAAITHAFRQAIAPLALSNAAAKVVYATFVQALQPPLGRLYARLTELTEPFASPTDEGALSTMRSSEPQRPLRPAPARVDHGDHRPQAGSHARAVPAPAQGVERTPPRAAPRRLAELPAPAPGAPRDAPQAPAAGEPQPAAFLGFVLARLGAREGGSAELKSLVGQWQAPLLRLARRDPGILDDPHNPARRLIDQLGIAALATDEHDRIAADLRTLIREWTPHLAGEAGANPDFLDQAAAELRQLTGAWLRARDLRIEQVRETAEARHRITKARRVAQREIARRVGGRQTPRAVTDLLDLGWRQWLTLTHLRAGSDNPPWREGLAVLDRLLRWLRPESPLPEAQAACDLVDFVAGELALVCPDDSARRGLVDTLVLLLTPRAGDDPRRHHPWILVPPDPDQEPAADGRPPQERPLDERLRRLRSGDWLRIPAAPGAPPQPLRLSWIGDDPGPFVFTDANGRRQLELTAADLLALLSHGRAVPVESLDLPLTERSVAELLGELNHQANHDPVTGLYNRRGFLERLAQSRGAARAQEGQVLCLVALEEHQVINRLCGMEAADALLRETAALLAPELRRGEIAARVGDDRLAFWLSEPTPAAGDRARRLLDRVRRHRFRWQQRSFPLSAHLGLAPAADGAGDPDLLLRNADAACLHAKEQGVNQIQVYRPDDLSLSAQSKLLDWAGRIDTLFAEGRLFQRCQRIAPLRDPGQASHFEILLGVRDEAGRVVPPGELIAAAERWQRIEEIDRWQVDAVIGWIEQWPERFAALGGLSINLSGRSLTSSAFLQFLEARLAGTAWPRERLTFEVTETAAVRGFEQAERFIRRIRRYGCRFSLGDFGTGHASYACLQNLQADFLKIDGSFIRALAGSENARNLVRSISEIAHSLGMRTVAESVESEAVLTALGEIGVDYAQGSHVGMPIPLRDLRP